MLGTPFKAVTEVGFSVRYLTVGFFILLYQLAVLSLVREKVTFVDRPERFKGMPFYSGTNKPKA